jgi:hypothetical protein
VDNDVGKVVNDETARLRRSDDLPEVGMTVVEMVRDHEKRIHSVENAQLVMLTTTKTIKWMLGVTLGTSVLGVILMLASLADLIRIGR